MFSVNTSPYNFATLFDTLQGLQQFQQHQRQVQQYQDTKPKIVKKIETEDSYQIQIFKKNGDFNLYEVKVLRNTYPYTTARSNLVNLVIESEDDDFRKIFQFSLDDIDVSNIDWEYFPDQNVLVLTVPKKVRYCSDDYANTVLASIFGVPHLTGNIECHGSHHQDRKALKDAQKEARRAERLQERELRKQEDAELAAARKAAKEKKEAERKEAERKEAERKEAARQEAERLEAERLAREAERAKEAARKAEEARKQKEEERKRQQEHAKRVAEERARREAAVRQKREEAQRQAQKKQEEDYQRRLAAQQEVLRQLFGGSGFFPYGFDVSQPDATSNAADLTAETAETGETVDNTFASATTGSESTGSPATTAAEPEPESTTPHDTEMVDSDSINSDTDADAKTETEHLHKHPSLEEVEDEEFVMFRKKFGDK